MAFTCEETLAHKPYKEFYGKLTKSDFFQHLQPFTSRARFFYDSFPSAF